MTFTGHPQPPHPPGSIVNGIHVLALIAGMQSAARVQGHTDSSWFVFLVIALIMSFLGTCLQRYAK